MYDVITIGSATRDVFLASHALHAHRSTDVANHIEACFPFGAKINVDYLHLDTGGGATNNATTFARLGTFKTAAVARVGNDEQGRAVVTALRAEHIDTRFIEMVKNEQTGYSTILSPGSGVGERTILVYRGASKIISDVPLNSWRFRSRWLYLSSLGNDNKFLKKILDHAERTKAQVAMNPGSGEISSGGAFRSLAHRFAFLILNRMEAGALTNLIPTDVKTLLRALVKICPNVIMTDGAAGAYAVTNEQKPVAYFIPSVGHAPKNITGAGDAFGSGFLTGWIKSKGNIEESLHVGALNADSVVQHVGAKVGILSEYPSLSALRKLPVRKIKI